MKNEKILDIKNTADMLSLDQLLPKAGGSVFRLARIAITRSLEIHFGNPPLIDFLPAEKETTTALREIARGRVAIKPEKKKSND